MSRFARNLEDPRGFTLIEVMVAVLILTVGVLSMLALIDVANGATLRTKAREAGTNLSRELVEAAQGIPYNRLTPVSVREELEARPGLNDSSPGGDWTIRRRGVTFDVSASVCSTDDDKDGVGSLDPGIRCPESPFGQSADTDPDDYKRVDIQLSWLDPGRPANTARQTTIINNPGNTIGPTVAPLTLSNPSPAGTLKITSPSTTQAEFDLTTSNVPATVNWLVDGGVEGQASGSGLTWNFDWSLGPVTDPNGVPDGTYQVGAQAFLASGVFGPVRTVTVALNRRDAIAPAKFAGGRNGNVVEFEWLPNPEKDIIGYRVYRTVDGTRVGGPVCETEKKTSCLDPSPPPPPPPPEQSTLHYEIVALDRDPNGNVREGVKSTATVTSGNLAPSAPSNLSAQLVGGAVVLNWTAAPQPDPDSGELLYYRIYRNGTLYEDRYDVTGSGTETTYTDTGTGGVTHQYWITAVDGQLAESSAVGPEHP